MCLSAISK